MSPRVVDITPSNHFTLSRVHQLDTSICKVYIHSQQARIDPQGQRIRKSRFRKSVSHQVIHTGSYLPTRYLTLGRTYTFCSCLKRSARPRVIRLRRIGVLWTNIRERGISRLGRNFPAAKKDTARTSLVVTDTIPGKLSVRTVS